MTEDGSRTPRRFVLLGLALGVSVACVFALAGVGFVGSPADPVVDVVTEEEVVQGGLTTNGPYQFVVDGIVRSPVAISLPDPVGIHSPQTGLLAFTSEVTAKAGSLDFVPFGDLFSVPDFVAATPGGTPLDSMWFNVGLLVAGPGTVLPFTKPSAIAARVDHEAWLPLHRSPPPAQSVSGDSQGEDSHMVWVFAISAAILSFLGTAMLLYDRFDGSQSASVPAPRLEQTRPQTGLTDEERVQAIIDENGGRIRQKEIVARVDWSKAKVSRVLSRLEENDEVVKLRLGRENLVCLPGHEPTTPPRSHQTDGGEQNL